MEYKKRTKYTPNEIKIKKDIIEIYMYDPYGKYKGFGIASLCDLEIIKKYKWYIDSTGYMRTTLPNGTKIRLHNLLMNSKNIDHIDRNKLNNTRNNLRICERWQNSCNVRQYNSKDVIGVYNSKDSYIACIEHFGKRTRKKYKNREEAIVQRLIWDINLFNEYSPQLQYIENKYPLLLLGLYGNTIKDDYENIKRIIKYYKKESNDYNFFEEGENVK